VIISSVLLGIGSAAGVVGLAFHNVGVLGKLYSEAIEGIDPGPLEAITATGANRIQVIWTAVIPQIVNPYISFTIYRLDANVRLAPILGLVGGGGIGILLFQSINLLQYGAAGLIIFMIVITVAAMDYAFAKQAKVEIGLCERHRRSRAINIALISLAVLGASMLVFTQVHATDVVLPLLATAGLIGGVIGLLYAAVGTRIVRATKITDTHVWLKGAGEPFLASLPDE